jgi:hypothetical protein
MLSRFTSVTAFPLPGATTSESDAHAASGGKAIGGYIPSKRRSFYGVRLRLMMTKEG